MNEKRRCADCGEEWLHIIKGMCPPCHEIYLKKHPIVDDLPVKRGKKSQDDLIDDMVVDELDEKPVVKVRRKSLGSGNTKKKRGRPPKDKQASATAKRRGRPRKEIS